MTSKNLAPAASKESHDERRLSGGQRQQNETMALHNSASHVKKKRHLRQRLTLARSRHELLHVLCGGKVERAHRKNLAELAIKPVNGTERHLVENLGDVVPPRVNNRHRYEQNLIPEGNAEKHKKHAQGSVQTK